MTPRILSEIWIYPVKSLGGLRVSSAQVMEKGLRGDRRWMLMDDQGKFLTQRSWPRMALFRMSRIAGSFVVSHGGDEIALPAEVPASGHGIGARVWDDAITVVEAADEYHRWFSNRLGFSCRLVGFPEANPRPVDPNYRLHNEHVSLADGYPVLVIGQASLDDLNSRLAVPVPMNRFRPNLVFTGGKPYEEDQWRDFRIGGNAFVGVKPCSRCVLTTVDQETAVPGKEPLLTLSRYRRVGEKIYFGQNVIPVDYHEIREGDEIILS